VSINPPEKKVDFWEYEKCLGGDCMQKLCDLEDPECMAALDKIKSVSIMDEFCLNWFEEIKEGPPEFVTKNYYDCYTAI